MSQHLAAHTSPQPAATATGAKLLRELTMAVRAGGTDPTQNLRLRMALLCARAHPLPEEQINLALQRGTGHQAAAYLEGVFEGNIPDGPALVIEVATDNLNRTLSTLRTHFSRYGGSLGLGSAQSFLFGRKAVLQVPATGLNEDNFVLQMIEAGADDLQLANNHYHLQAEYDRCAHLLDRLESMHLTPTYAALERIAYAPLAATDSFPTLQLVHSLLAEDDVLRVYHNVLL